MSQLEDLLAGLAINYYYRRGKDENGDMVGWPDSFADNYLHRPDALERCCTYCMVMNYEVVYQGSSSQDGSTDENENSSSRNKRSSKKYKSGKLHFWEDHPSKKRSHMRELKHIQVPVIYSKQSFPDIASLELYTQKPPSENAKLQREYYAKVALLLFYPFRGLDELRHPDDGTFWSKYKSARDSGELWSFDPRRPLGDDTNSSRALEVLQNIQDKLNCKKMKRPKDTIAQTTECKESTGGGNKKRKGEAEASSYDYDLSELEALFSGGGETASEAGFPERPQSESRNTAHIRNRANITDDQITDPPSLGQSSFGLDQGQTLGSDSSASNSGDNGSNRSSANNGDDDDANSRSSTPPDRRNFLALIQFIQGAVLNDGAHRSNDAASNEGDEATPDHSISAVAEEFGLSNDEKQLAAYEIICSTFVLKVLSETVESDAVSAAASAMEADHLSRLQDVKDRLKKMGGEEQLLMFLTGAGGCGKSHVISAARKFCHRFSQQVGVMFDTSTFYLTAYVGSAAALWGGITIHTAAHLNRTKITDAHCKEWENVKILVIDEVSYFSFKDLENLDKKLRRLKQQPGSIYGGVSIVFAGDLHQLEPFGAGAQPFYYNYNMRWHGAINSAIILQSNHRFKDDPEYGELLGRIRSNTHTQADIETINSRLFKDRSDLPQQGEETCYACAYNKERNSVSQAIFQGLIQNNPLAESDEMPSDEVIVIESVFRKGRSKCSKEFHEFVFEQCGDAQVATSHSKRVDPALKWYPGIPLMITSNEHIKKKRGNGTLCRGLRVQLKEGVQPQWKNYDGRKVFTVTADDCEYMLCEHWKAEKEGEDPVQFKLEPEHDSVVMRLPLFQGKLVSVGGVKASQFGVNSNIATTGHKLQGMSKDNIVVVSWSTQHKNWIYVVLSRVRTLKGLHLLQRLPLSTDFSVDIRLLREEERLAEIEEHVMLRRRERS